MVKKISLKDFSDEDQILLLKELGYGSDGIFVTKGGERFLDRYVNEPIMIENMLILPGSEIIIDNNPLSIASYLEEFPDVL